MFGNRSARPLRVTVACSLLVAMSIVCGKFLQIPLGDVLRFSFENLPILFAGMAFGPLAGALVGALADLIGCVAVGYTVNPLVTLGAVAVGLVGGGVFRLAARLPRVWRVTLTVSAAHLIASVGIKTVGLAAFYSMPFGVLLLWRLLNYALVGAVEGFLLAMLFKNKALAAVIGYTAHPKENNHDL